VSASGIHSPILRRTSTALALLAAAWINVNCCRLAQAENAFVPAVETAESLPPCHAHRAASREAPAGKTPAGETTCPVCSAFAYQEQRFVSVDPAPGAVLDAPTPRWMPAAFLELTLIDSPGAARAEQWSRSPPGVRAAAPLYLQHRVLLI
jgi:hypothetical protein